MKPKFKLILIVLASALAALWYFNHHSNAVDNSATTKQPITSKVLPTISTANAYTPPKFAASGGTQKQWLDRNASRLLVLAAAAVLPPFDAPLGETLAVLKEQAEKGNPVAGCRLAMQLQRCSPMTDIEREITGYRENIAHFEVGSEGYKAFAEKLANEEPNFKELKSKCESIPKVEIDNAWRYGLAAAMTGHLPAIAEYTTSPPLDEKQFNRQPEGWEQYRLNVPYLLDIGAEAGDRRVVEWQARLLRGGWPHIGGFNLPADPERALMMHLVLAKLPKSNFTGGSKDEMTVLRSKLNEEGIARAETRAAEFYNRVYGQRTDLKPMRGGAIDSNGEHCEKPVP